MIARNVYFCYLVPTNKMNFKSRNCHVYCQEKRSENPKTCKNSYDISPKAECECLISESARNEKYHTRLQIHKKQVT